MWKSLAISSCGLYNNKPLLNYKQICNLYFSKNSRIFSNQNSKGMKKKNGSSGNQILKRWYSQIKQSYQTGNNSAYHATIENIPKNHWGKKQMTIEHSNFLYNFYKLFLKRAVMVFDKSCVDGQLFLSSFIVQHTTGCII